jgi:zinc/manganese transport system substrate-binding protein
MNRLWQWLWVGGAAALLGAGGAGAAPLRVVTLSPLLTEIAREIGGPDVTVVSLLPPGVDPHTFEPAPADMRGLEQAELVLASGLGLENYLDKLAANSGTQASILAVGDALHDPVRITGRDGRIEPDPHWWNSVSATADVSRTISRELASRRPDAAAAIARRTTAWLGRLDALEAWSQAQVATLPRAQRELVTSHDAFAWFARDYGFTVHPVAGLSPGAEPNARDLARLVDLFRRCLSRTRKARSSRRPSRARPAPGSAARSTRTAWWPNPMGAPMRI